MAIDKNNVIDSCRDFLKASAERYASTILAQQTALSDLGGNFWTDARKKEWKIGKKPVKQHNIFRTRVNGVAAAYNNSPWHINLNEQRGNLQGVIDSFESEEAVKGTFESAFYRGVAIGSGIITIGVDENGKPMLEFANSPASVALDPNIHTTSGKDARKGATVRWLSLEEAQEQFGADVIPNNYPTGSDGLSLPNVKVWGNREGYLQIVNYYVKENGAVTLWKICGQKVVAKPIVLPIDTIPIVRFAGYEQYNVGIDAMDYYGMVQDLEAAQVETDIPWVQTMRRMNGGLKARMIMGKSAMNGMKEFLQAMGEDDTLGAAYNDTPVNGVVPQPPIITNENFNTGDLTQVLQNGRTTMVDVSGIPMEGPAQVERTAQEILTQSESREANVSLFYKNAKDANEVIGRIVVMMFNGGEFAEFSLENGPSVITTNMKRRQEIGVIASMYPEDKKMLLAPAMCETIDSSLSDKLADITKANLPEGTTLPNDGSAGAAIHALKETQRQFDECMKKAQELDASNADLQKQVDELTRALSDMREQNAMELYKFKVDTALKIQQTDFENEMERKKFINEQSKIILDAQQQQDKLQLEAGKALVNAGR